MVQLKILSGKKAGAVWVARRFPVRIGRAGTAELQVEEDGVWDQHARIEWERPQGLVLAAHPEAPTTINRQRVERALLRNGDEIGLGSLRLQFWLSETRQAGLRLREWAVWTGIAALVFGQIALMAWLSQQ